MFTINKQTDYGLRFLIELAEKRGGEPLSLRVFAKKQGISFLFLQKVARKLRRRGIIKSIKGPRGGYYLAINPEKLTLKEVFATLEGSCQIISCLDEKIVCPAKSHCSTKRGLVHLNNKIIKSLKETTLKNFK